MTTLEMVEKLRERAGVTYDDAKAALDASGGDLLEAMILLEKQGKIDAPQNGGQYSSKQEQGAGREFYQDGYYGKDKNRFSSGALSKFIKFCGKLIHKANTNMLEVRRGGKYIVSMPLSVVLILLILSWWVTLVLLAVGLFLGYRYRFRGADVENSRMNSAMDAVTVAAENLKDEITSNTSKTEDK